MKLGVEFKATMVAINLITLLPILYGCGKVQDPVQVHSGPRGTSEVSDRKVSKLVLSSVKVLAGSLTAGAVDGIGTAAQLNRPHGLALGPTGALYFADRGNHQIRSLDPTSLDVKTIAGSGTAGMRDDSGKLAQFNQPIAVAVGKSGVVYIADRENHRIRKMALDGAVTTLAGTGVAGYRDGLASEAQFKQPYGVAINNDETALFVADYLNHAIRKIEIASREVTTLAGNGSPGFTDGEGSNARFNQPYSIKLDGNDLFIPDQLNHSIRKLSLSGAVSTIAGNGKPGYSDGKSFEAQFNNPTGVAIGPDGTLYVADRNNNRIRVVSAGGVTTLTGTGVEGDKNGSLSEAEFRHPLDLTLDQGKKFLVVSEDKGHRIRVIE